MQIVNFENESCEGKDRKIIWPTQNSVKHDMSMVCIYFVVVNFSYCIVIGLIIVHSTYYRVRKRKMMSCGMVNTIGLLTVIVVHVM